MKTFLYTNYDTRASRVVFRDLLPASRPYGSNESEEILANDADIAEALRRCERDSVETVDLLGGQRFYLK